MTQVYFNGLYSRLLLTFVYISSRKVTSLINTVKDEEETIVRKGNLVCILVCHLAYLFDTLVLPTLINLKEGSCEKFDQRLLSFIFANHHPKPSVIDIKTHVHLLLGHFDHVNL